MLKRIQTLYEYSIRAKDGEIGSVHDAYFSDRDWQLRYLIVETGSWLQKRKVLLSPHALGEPLLMDEALPVNLTRAQVENSPEVDLAKPVSQQRLEALHQHYEWPWSMPNFVEPNPPEPPATMPPAPIPPAAPKSPPLPSSLQREVRAAINGPPADAGNPFLRSSREVLDYVIQAEDGQAGKVIDMLVDLTPWTIRYLLVDTGAWLANRPIILATAWITSVAWSDASVYVDLSREAIENGPEYDPKHAVGRDYEVLLHQHYGRRGYWEKLS